MRRQKNHRRSHFREEMNYNKSLGPPSSLTSTQSQLGEKENNRFQPVWGLPSRMKKIEIKADIKTNPSLQNAEALLEKTIGSWDYTQNKNKIIPKALPSNMYYPPNCSGYDIAYCQEEQAIYIYGGIPCSHSLLDGIKPYFYKFKDGRWTEVHPESTYNPTPRYGHTLTPYNKELILFGGVSQYKDKLKDRCFYTDFSAYNTIKNNWRVVQTSGMDIKTRKNHSACVYSRYYLVYGGLDESQEIINEISWINLECRKPRWKYFSLPGRFNHKMVVVQPQNGKDFVCLFGGRNGQSEIVNTMFFLPFATCDGQLALKEVAEIHHTILPRELPIMGQFLDGFVILGGIDTDNQVVEDCWYCNNDQHTFTKIKLDISFKDLRGGKGCSLAGKMLYIMAGNSQNYRALQLLPQK